MTQNQERTTLPLTEELEVAMAQLSCSHCGHIRDVLVNNDVYTWTIRPGMGLREEQRHRYDTLYVTVECARCQKQSVFTLNHNAVQFAAGKLIANDLSDPVSPDSKGLFQDALQSFYGQSFKGVVAMCRAAVEAELETKNVHGPKKDDLFEKIEVAKQSKFLDEVQYTAAHAARIAGRDALHRMGAVSQSQALLALTATVEVLNHLAPNLPLPA
ncbi:MAG: DUF4145 domain-containing protein [Chloroflexi bacterium]|nr:DUF4145 domain-containing protein [Chloroflexota bacterium]